MSRKSELTARHLVGLSYGDYVVDRARPGLGTMRVVAVQPQLAPGHHSVCVLWVRFDGALRRLWYAPCDLELVAWQEGHLP